MSLAYERVTVCVVNRDGGQGLSRTLDALPVEVRVVVVDNASSDESQHCVNRRSFSTLIENPVNTGFARGSNLAARHAGGEVLVFLNNDAMLGPAALAELLEALAQDTSAVAVGPRLQGGGRDQPGAAGPAPRFAALLHRVRWLRWTGVFRAAHARYRHGLPAEPGPVERLGGAALVVWRRAFESVGGFDEAYPFGLEDVDLSLRLGERGRLLYVPSAVVQHEGGVSSAKHRGFAYRGFELGFARYTRLHVGRGFGWVYKVAVTLDQPVRLAGLGLRWLGAALRGRRSKCSDLAATARAVVSLVPSLPRLWWA